MIDQNKYSQILQWRYPPAWPIFEAVWCNPRNSSPILEYRREQVLRKKRESSFSDRQALDQAPRPFSDIRTVFLLPCKLLSSLFSLQSTLLFETSLHLFIYFWNYKRKKTFFLSYTHENGSCYEFLVLFQVNGQSVWAEYRRCTFVSLDLENFQGRDIL